MIVFWQEFRRSWQGQGACDWRCYKGRVRLRKGYLHTYPTNGTRKKLSSYIAFDTSHTPPRLITTYDQTGNCVDTLRKTGAICAHLPSSYIDLRGNIRSTASADLPLLLAGPDWNALAEEEFQQALELQWAQIDRPDRVFRGNHSASSVEASDRSRERVSDLRKLGSSDDAQNLHQQFR